MKSLAGQYRVNDLCAAFCVSRSGYHRWHTAGPSQRVREDALIGEELQRIHTQSRGTYGRPRLCAMLRRGGRCHSAKRIGRLMRQLKLRGVRRGSFRPQTTDSNHGLKRAANLLRKVAAPKACDQVWVADMTYVSTQEGWLYVAGVLDRYSRRVLGVAFGARLDASLPEAALHQALGHRGAPTHHGLLHHSDQGVQYASDSYRTLLANRGITPSMSRRANCYDNAHMESFWATLKAEALIGRRFATRIQAQVAIFDYIETFYNRARLHSALGYHSPVDFEQLIN